MRLPLCGRNGRGEQVTMTPEQKRQLLMLAEMREAFQRWRAVVNGLWAPMVRAERWGAWVGVAAR